MDTVKQSNHTGLGLTVLCYFAKIRTTEMCSQENSLRFFLAIRGLLFHNVFVLEDMQFFSSPFLH